MKPIFSLLLTFALMLSLACRPKNAGHEHEHGAAEEATHDDVDPHAIPLKDIPGARVQSVAEPSAMSVWFPAEIIADEASQFVLSSPVNGILGALLVPPGRLVAADTALVEVKSPELARLHADWLAARAKLVRAEAALAREERLNIKKATSQRDLEEATSEAEVARAEEGAAALALESLGIKTTQGGASWVLRAPRAGTVVAYKVVSGQGVSAGQELGLFLASGSVVVRAELAQGAAGKIEVGQTFAVRQSDGRQWKAKLEGVVPALSSETMRQTYRLRLAGDSLPLPGTPVEVEVPFPASITLPQAALQQIDGHWGVFVVTCGDDCHAVFREVVRGHDVKGAVMILDNISPGEKIVADSAYLLKAYQQKQSGGDEDGHVH